MFSCLLNLYFEVLEELLDGGVEGGVVVEGVALWGTVDLSSAVRVGLNADADEGAAEPCGLRLRIGVSDDGYGGRSSDVVDVAVAVDRVEREGVGAKSRLETAREHKVLRQTDFDASRGHKPYSISHLESEVELVGREDERLASRDREAAEEQHNFDAIGQVEMGSRLVEEHERRVLSESFGNDGALFFAIGDMIDESIGFVRKVDIGECFVNDFVVVMR